MVYPRQRLYDINHIGYIKKAFCGKLNCDEPLDFEGAFRELTGLEGAIALSRGRLGLYFALKHFLTEKRKKVLITPFTIFDVINMIICAGGEPVFCDSISPYSPHVSIDELEKNYTDEVGALIVTHYHNNNHLIEEIATWCKQRDIKLIEDCAISLGGSINGKSVGSFGDAAYFSFGLFKFVAAYFGGAVWFRDREIKEKVINELKGWPRMEAKDINPYFFKGLKLSILTTKYIFDYFTFPIFRYGFLHDIEFIKNQAKNDPDPNLKTSLPEEYKRSVSIFQLNEFVRQFSSVKTNMQKRVQNANTYYQILKNSEDIVISEPKNGDCFLNFPIVFKNKDRNEMVKEIMKRGFDVAIYYYRNCAEVKCFKNYYKELPNLNYYVKNLIFIPTYPKVSEEYASRLANAILELVR